jgi:hypothetical protein
MILYMVCCVIFLGMVARHRYRFECAVAEMYAQEADVTHANFGRNSHPS